MTASGSGVRRPLAALTAATAVTAVTVAVAVTLSACGSSGSHLSRGAAAVTSAPVRVARTRLGAVGYRAVGSGPPLVLIMGFGWTMEGWDPRLVHALAQHHRVIMFDNAGVGRTRALPAPLTVDAMASQTSALSTPCTWAGRTSSAGPWAA
jgi:pimeloyl-ACP methyl ester carboxylesterase